MTTEEKFNAAVNVIRSLPKNGSYQPSNEMMLKFYGFFKQATQGQCIGSRPPFWEPIGRAKYDAWKKLGSMPKTDAMASYVDELHTIVETMSYSDNVASFLDAPSTELDSLKIEDLELVVGDVIERVRSQPNSPLASRDTSPSRLISSLGSSRSISPARDEESDHSDGEYVDTIESMEPKKNIPNGDVPSQQAMTNGYSSHRSRTKARSATTTPTAIPQPPPTSGTDISQEIAKAVQSLRTDIERISAKVTALEKSKTAVGAVRKPPFGVSRKLLAFIIVWPFVAGYIMRNMATRQPRRF